MQLELSLTKKTIVLCLLNFIDSNTKQSVLYILHQIESST